MKIPRKPIKINPVHLIVENIRSSENVGSFFRTSDALGIEKIYLVGYTPKPLDKFNRPDSKIAKTALGAEKVVPYESYKTITPLINKLKKQGYLIVALEQAPNGIDYRKFKSKKPIALIVGNEVSGVPKTTLNKCDSIIEIPMLGIKESLNVSVATGIALAELTK
jgi:23S rRNA (guanosine2251-2'-O)-methyltransferase